MNHQALLDKLGEKPMNDGECGCSNDNLILIVTPPRYQLHLSSSDFLDDVYDQCVKKGRAPRATRDIGSSRQPKPWKEEGTESGKPGSLQA